MEEQSKLYRTTSFKKFLRSKAFMLLIMIVVIVIFFTILSGGRYISMFSLRNTINSMVVTSFLTLGAAFLMISGNVDLSTAQIATIAGVLMAIFINSGMLWWLAVILVFIICALIGLINSVLINELRFIPFVATMSVSYVVQGAMYLLTSGRATDVNEPHLTWLGTYRVFNNEIPLNVVLTFVVFAVYGVILAKTRFGKSLYMIGGNPAAARLSGLKPKKMWYALFINNAILGSAGGMLQAARLKSATTSGIANGMFSGMTGAILGGVSFGGGSGGMGGAFIGLIMINAFNNGLTILGIDPYWQTAASGALLLIALTFDYFNNKRLNKMT